VWAHVNFLNLFNGQLRLSEWSLRALLVLLVVDVFVVAPIAQEETASALQPTVHALVLVSGVVIASRSRAPILIAVGMLAVVGFVTHLMYHEHPSVPLRRADTGLSLLFSCIILAVMLHQLFRAGPITWYRIEGAVAVYLLLAYSWALAYQLAALGDVNAFRFPAAPIVPQSLRFRLLYFSITTLTSVTYGDIIPLGPVARSLAALEAVIGQLFPVLLLARLVSMELYDRRQRGH